MVIKLRQQHREKIFRLVEKEKELNLFIIGDLENYGFDEDFLEYWGDINEEGELNAILMRFYEDFIVYADGEFDVEGFTKVLIENDFKHLSGEKSTVERFLEHHNFSQKRNTYFAKLDNNKSLYKGEVLNEVKETKIDDLELVLDLLHKIDEFENIGTLERMKRKYLDKTGRGYHIKAENGQIVSSAETAAENSMSAMVIGVCTHPEYRKKGYASAVVSKLCYNLLDEGKSLCLFYDNPKAGDIYKGLGFKDIGVWSMWKR